MIAVISESNSSRFSFNFFTSDSMALFAKPSLSPPCRWHIKLCTMLKQASADVGAFVANPDIAFLQLRNPLGSCGYTLTKRSNDSVSMVLVVVVWKINIMVIKKNNVVCYGAFRLGATVTLTHCDNWQLTTKSNVGNLLYVQRLGKPKSKQKEHKNPRITHIDCQSKKSGYFWHKWDKSQTSNVLNLLFLFNFVFIFYLQHIQRSLHYF